MKSLMLCVMTFVIGYEAGNPQRVISVALIAALVASMYLSKGVTK